MPVGGLIDFFCHVQFTAGVVLSLSHLATKCIRAHSFGGIIWYIFHNRDMKFCFIINSKTSGKVTQIDPIMNFQDGSIQNVEE